MEKLARERLVQAGIRATASRIAVLDALVRHKGSHVTAEDLYLDLRQKGFRLGLATVYRVLSGLESHGLARRNQFGKAKAHFEPVESGAHFHMVDVGGRDVREFEDAALLRHLGDLAARSGFQVVDVELNLYVRPSPFPSADPSLTEEVNV